MLHFDMSGSSYPIGLFSWPDVDKKNGPAIVSINESMVFRTLHSIHKPFRSVPRPRFRSNPWLRFRFPILLQWL